LGFVLDDRVHQLRIDRLGAGGKAIHQSGVTKDIDGPRNAKAGVGNDLAGLIREQLLPRSDRTQTMIDVLCHFAAIQGLEVKIRRYALGKLQQLWRAKHVLELRLADQDDL
jgi:hypothetical protein